MDSVCLKGGIVPDVEYFRHVNVFQSCNAVKCFCKKFTLKRVQILPSLDIFGGVALVNEEEQSSLVLSQTTALCYIITLFKEKMNNGESLPNLLSHFKKRFKSSKFHSFYHLLFVPAAVSHANIDWDLVLEWLQDQSTIWLKCLDLSSLAHIPYKLATRTHRSVEDRIYLLILLKLLFNSKGVDDFYLNRICDVTDSQCQKLRLTFERYKLICLNRTSSFVTVHLFSNPSPYHIIVDCWTCKILVSSSMCQETMWLLPLPLKVCTQKLFLEVSMVLRFYFRGFTNPCVRQSLERLQDVSRSLGGKQLISKGLRMDTFAQPNQRLSIEIANELQNSLATDKSEIPMECQPNGSALSVLNSRLEMINRELALASFLHLNNVSNLTAKVICQLGKKSLRQYPKIVRCRIEKSFWNIGLSLIVNSQSPSVKLTQFFQRVFKFKWKLPISEVCLDIFWYIMNADGELEANYFLQNAWSLISQPNSMQDDALAELKVYDLFFSLKNEWLNDSANVYSQQSSTTTQDKVEQLVKMCRRVRAGDAILRKFCAIFNDSKLVKMVENAKELMDT